MASEITASEANRCFYADIASDYDGTEDCVVSPRQQEKLRTALRTALDLVGEHPRVLDACGGTGNVGTILLGRGIVPVVVDVSHDMLSIWKSKAEKLGHKPEVHVAEISEFFVRDERSWDLITFSSALHHLEDYERVLATASLRLAPGGVILSMFDPTEAGWLVRKLRRLDWVVYALRHQPRGFPRLLRAKMNRAVRSEKTEFHVGRMAERHAIDGMDDTKLRAQLEADGLEVKVHERYFDARFRIVRWMFRLLRRPSSFHLLVQRPA